VTAYRDYRFRLRLRAPLGTPMHADTLFGHLVWQVIYAEGPGEAAAFLEPFLGGRPPFVLSDAFPAGLLPRPLFPAALPADQSASRENYARMRKIGKAPFIPVEDFLQFAVNPEFDLRPVASPWHTVKIPHAAIDRLTGTTTPGGQFYETEYLVLAPREGVETGLLDLYVRAETDWADRVETLLRGVAASGFGRDRSTGLGAFEVTAREDIGGLFGEPAGRDGFISLSSWVPAAEDPTEGRWRLRVKRGFLGEGAGRGNPFKRALLQLEPGSVMRCGTPPAPWYGRMVRNIAPGMPEAVQYGFALAVPCRWR